MNEGLGRAATPEHLAHVAVPGWGQGRAAHGQGAQLEPSTLFPTLSHSIPTSLHPHLPSIPTSPPCPLCPAAAHRSPRALAFGCRQLAVLIPVASMLLSPLVPQNQCC